MKKRILIIVLLICIITFTSCRNDNRNNERTKLVFEYQSGHIDEEFESEIESKFNVDIIMKNNNSLYPGFRLKQELSHGMGPDFIVGEYINSMEDSVLSSYLYDLGGEEFVNNYYLSTIETLTKSNGGLYFLPGPCYVYGIVYDKTMFKKLNLELPYNYSSFVELINKINSMNLVGYEPISHTDSTLEEVKVKAFVPTIKWSDMFQIIFNSLNYNALKGIDNTIWLNNYQNGNESMVGHMEEAANRYLKLFSDGVLSLDMWDIKAPYRSSKLYSYHTSLMTIECQQGYEYNIEANKDDLSNMHEMGMMPFYTSDERDSGYLYAIPRSYFCATKAAMNDNNKREALLEILNYLSTTAGQKLLINGEDYFGFLKGNTCLDSDFYSDVIDTIKEGRIIKNFYYENNNSKAVENYLHKSTKDLVLGNISVNEWLTGADKARDNCVRPEAEEVYGICKDNMNSLQTAYLIGKSYLYSFDADIAFVPVSVNYGTTACLYTGNITDKVINDANTQNSYYSKVVEGDLNFVIVTLTGSQLLEYARKSSNNGLAAFAGIDMTVKLIDDYSIEYLSLKINNEELDLNKTYRVVTLKGLISTDNVIEECEGYKFYDIFKQFIINGLNGVVEAPKELIFIE